MPQRSLSRRIARLAADAEIEYDELVEDLEELVARAEDYAEAVQGLREAKGPAGKLRTALRQARDTVRGDPTAMVGTRAPDREAGESVDHEIEALLQAAGTKEDSDGAD